MTCNTAGQIQPCATHALADVLELALIDLIAAGALDRDAAVAAIESAAAALSHTDINVAIITNSLLATSVTSETVPHAPIAIANTG